MSAPYGLRDIDVLNSKATRFPPLTAKIHSNNPLVNNTYILYVEDGFGNTVVDAHKVGEENMQEALQFIADIAGAATGCEIINKGERP